MKPSRGYFHRGARVPGQRRPVTPTQLENLTGPGIRRATGLAPSMPLTEELAGVDSRGLLSKLALPEWGRRR
jgi:hypothetical protein